MTAPPEIRAMIGEDQRLQRRVWVVQRLGWVVMAVVVIAASAGLLGAGGPWSTAILAIGRDRAELPRVMRWEADEEMRIILAPGAGTATVGIGGEFIRYADIRSIMPKPIESTAIGDTFVFTFARQRTPTALAFRFRVSAPDIRMRTVIAIDGERAQRAVMVLP